MRHFHPAQAPRFTDILSIGIGGSALGPQFVAAALAPDVPPMKIHFIDNTDPAGMDRVLTRLQDRLKSTLVIITSKSGGTPETRNAKLEVRHAFEQQGLNFAAHAVAISVPESPMAKLRQAEGWLAKFPMFDWVGGRTSQMSAVGLLSASLLGIDIHALLAGAKAMDEATRVPDLKRNPAALLALSWYAAGNGKGEKDMVMLPYKEACCLLSLSATACDGVPGVKKRTWRATSFTKAGCRFTALKGLPTSHRLRPQLRGWDFQFLCHLH